MLVYERIGNCKPAAYIYPRVHYLELLDYVLPGSLELAGKNRSQNRVGLSPKFQSIII